MNLKNIKLLIKLKKQELDEKRKNLTIYRENIAKLEYSLVKLEAELKAEQQIIDKDNLFSSFYNNYYNNYKNKKDQLSSQITKYNDLINDIEEKLIQDFADIKKFEVISKNYVIKKQLLSEQKNQILLDEIILNKFQQ